MRGQVSKKDKSTHRLALWDGALRLMCMGYKPVRTGKNVLEKENAMITHPLEPARGDASIEA